MFLNVPVRIICGVPWNTIVVQEAMELSSRHEEVREFVKRKFGEECPGLVDLVDATPPNQIHRRRIEVNWPRQFSHQI